MNEKLLQEAATWIWDRKDKADWWTYLVLTPENPDPENLGILRNQALQIFTILEERRLILPSTEIINNRLYPVFKLNFNTNKEWQDLTSKKGIWKLHILPFLKWSFKKSWLFIIWVISLAIASGLQVITKKIINKFWP